MNALWLLIPVKPFDEGKSRLATSLSVEQRADLTRRILLRTLTIADATARFKQIVVISRDPAVHEAARCAHVFALAEESNGLNRALEQARAMAVAGGASAILVLPSDLPFVTYGDLDVLIGAAHAGNKVVIAPSCDGGTNALLLTPPTVIDFAFGHDSFRLHTQQARGQNVSYRVFRSPTLAYDIDWPADLHAALAGGFGSLSTVRASFPQACR